MIFMIRDTTGRYAVMLDVHSNCNLRHIWINTASLGHGQSMHAVHEKLRKMRAMSRIKEAIAKQDHCIVTARHARHARHVW